MKEFPISFEMCLGYHCYGGGEYVDAEGLVQLEDAQVDQLVALIRDSGGETDIEKLRLQERFPAIYEALESAFSDAASEASYNYWAEELGECEDFDDPGGYEYTVEIPQGIIGLAHTKDA